MAPEVVASVLVLQALHDSTPIELPKALVDMETQNMVQQARTDLESRGLKMESRAPRSTLAPAKAQLWVIPHS